MPQVEYEDIIPGEGTLNKDLRDKDGGKTGIKFYAGDVLYGKLRPYLMNWLYPQFNGVAVGDFWVLRATECDSSFLYRLIQTNSFQRLANVSAGSKMPRADWKLISQSFFAVPADHAEQKEIAKSLAELDSLITLHQRKRRKRLFTHLLVWEQRKFSAVAIERRETTEVEDEDVLLTCAIEGIFLNSDYFSHFRGQSNIGYLKVRKNMLILSAQNLHLGNANVNLKYDHGIISPAYKVYDLLNCSPLFMYSWVKRPNAIIFFDQATTAGASLCRKNIEWNYLNNLPLCLPASLKEQHQIGSFFARLDNLITLHQ